MGRKRKFKSAKELEEAWSGYKKDCNERYVLTHDFSSKNSEFVSAELKRSVTYTIEAFAHSPEFRGQLSMSITPKMRDMLTRLRACARSAR